MNFPDQWIDYPQPKFMLGPPRDFGEQGNNTIYSMGTREQKYKSEGNNQEFDFRIQGKMPIFFSGEKGIDTPPHWEVLCVRCDTF